MDLSPHLARTIAFKKVRKGYDPGEVDAFKERAAAAIEAAQNQAASMEARARAAVSKLQELSARQGAGSPATGDAAETAPTATTIEATQDEANVISRTLLLAQRTADQTLAEATEKADKLVAEARAAADGQLSQSRSQAAKMIEDARNEARQAAEQSRIEAQNEVESLLAKRDFLSSDVDALEQHVGAQRERVREAAHSLLDLSERVTGGLGEMRRPLLSASDDRDPTPAAAAALDADVAEASISVAGSADDSDVTLDSSQALDFES